MPKRVFDEVLNDDPQHPGPQGQLQTLVLDLDLEPDAGSLGSFVEFGDDLSQQRRGLSRAERDDLASRFELAQEEDVVDQLVHQLDLRPHPLESLCRIAARQTRSLDQREQARERRPQLV
jgi:hypothetical protein